MILKATLASIAACGYSLLICELPISKAAIALLTACCCWFVQLFAAPARLAIESSLGKSSQLFFFLLGAMFLVEVIDAHGGKELISNRFSVARKQTAVILISTISFLLSALLDNVTTTILMVSILQSLIADRKERLLPSCLIVVAANAGGAWTPIGDVTTTMLWMANRLSPLPTIATLALPSLVAFLLPLLLSLPSLSGFYPPQQRREKKEIHPWAIVAAILPCSSFPA